MTHCNLRAILTVLGDLVMTAVSPPGAARAAEVPHPIQIDAPAQQSCVPARLRRGTVLPPQSVSAVDLSDDGRFVAVGTMAFRHDRNFWLLSAETGDVGWGRYVET